MKRLSFLILAVVLFAACKKNQTHQPAPSASKIAGKWTINSVTVNALDSAGKYIPFRSHVYPEPASYYFQFNNDGTWTEHLAADSIPDFGESGNYVLNSDTGFTLLKSGGISTPCKISSISSSLFIFTHQRSTKFDGTIPGFLEYVFKLTR